MDVLKRTRRNLEEPLFPTLPFSEALGSAVVRVLSSHLSWIFDLQPGRPYIGKERIVQANVFFVGIVHGHTDWTFKKALRQHYNPKIL